MNLKNISKINISAVLLIVFLIFGFINPLEAKQLPDTVFDNVPLKKLPLKEAVEYGDKLPYLKTVTETQKIMGWLWPDMKEEYIDGIDVVCKLKLSERFNTILVRRKTEFYGESFLVNYDKDFNKLGVLCIADKASDDAEYQNSVKTAEIKENEIIITISYYDYLTEADGIEKEVYSVSGSGEFEKQMRKDVRSLPLIEGMHERDLDNSEGDYFINLSDKFKSKIVITGDSANKSKALINFTVDKRNNETIIDSLEIATGPVYDASKKGRSVKSRIDKDKITVSISGSDSGENGTFVYLVTKNGKFELQQEQKTGMKE